MQIMCATGTACVIVSAIHLDQPPPGSKGGDGGWGKFTLGRSPRKWARCPGYNQVRTVPSHGKPAGQIIPHLMRHHYYE